MAEHGRNGAGAARIDESFNKCITGGVVRLPPIPIFVAVNVPAPRDHVRVVSRRSIIARHLVAFERNLPKDLAERLCRFSFLPTMIYCEPKLVEAGFKKGDHRGQARTERPSMREWLYVLVPIAVVFYFLIYPDQFDAFLTWTTSFFG
jgi:hypothetical protein